MYRKHYLIGLYVPIEEGETLIALLNDIKGFAEFMGIGRKNATQILHWLFTKKTRGIRFHGKICSVEFILDTDLEEE